MRRSSLPPRTTELARVIELRPGQSLPRRQGLRSVGVYDGGAERVTPLRPRPKDTIPLKVRTLVKDRDYGLCVHCSRPADHIHHRRLKGDGGDTGPHTDCPCNLVCVCWLCHSWAHAERTESEPEGLIIPRATLRPSLISVALHGFEDGGGAEAWPSCDGEWLDYEPGSPGPDGAA